MPAVANAVNAEELRCVLRSIVLFVAELPIYCGQIRINLTQRLFFQQRVCYLVSVNLCRSFQMKKIALAVALSVTASTAFAGGMAEPVMEAEVVAAATSSSSGGVIIPLLLLLIVAAAVAGSGTSGTETVLN